MLNIYSWNIVNRIYNMICICILRKCSRSVYYLYFIFFSLPEVTELSFEESTVVTGVLVCTRILYPSVLTPYFHVMLTELGSEILSLYV